MKIAIITWCNYHNYGTYLQAYALQAFLRKYNHEVSILDDYQYSVKLPSFVKTKILIKKLIKQVFFHSSLTDDKLDRSSDALYELFKQKYLQIDSDVRQLEQLDGHYDAYICGSDQIWNPCVFDRVGHEFYFASFGKKPKIAYAPSIGVKEIPNEYKEHFSKLISDFAFLSTREKNASEILKDLSGRCVETVVDPTLLLSRQDWYQLVSPSEKTLPYIFVYLLTYNQTYIDRVYEYSERYNLKIRMVKPCGINIPIAGVEAAGPLEFLKLISNASVVMTDSFHAVLFSIIYKKQFVVFKRFKDTNRSSQNSRIENLLSMIKRQNCFVDEDTLSKIGEVKKFDFDEIDKKLAPYVNKSKDYLLNALNVVSNERS